MSLDSFGPPHALLEAKFKQFMDAIVMACDGGTASIDPKISGDSRDDSPTSAAAQDVRHWSREWRKRRTDRTRLELLKELQEYVSRLHFAPADQTERGTVEWQTKIAFDERDPLEVCDIYGISRATYYRIRGSLNLTRPKRRYSQ